MAGCCGVKLVLSDCVSKDPAEAQLQIVHEAVAESVRAQRDRMTQAVLAVRPSMIDVEGARLDEVLDCEDVKSIVASIGVGIWLPDYPGAFHIDGLRYGNVILMPQSSDLRAKLVAFFLANLRPLVDAGHVYLVADDWKGDVTSVHREATMLTCDPS